MEQENTGQVRVALEHERFCTIVYRNGNIMFVVWETRQIFVLFRFLLLVIIGNRYRSSVIMSTIKLSRLIRYRLKTDGQADE